MSHFTIIYLFVYSLCKYLRMAIPNMELAPGGHSVSGDSSGKGSIVEGKLVQNLTPIDSVAEMKLLRKCDLHVVPVVSLLYVLSFLDRINIGNARIQGLEKDLNMRGQDYNIALMVFFIPYILFEVPSNILIRKMAPSTWLSMLMVCWGIATQLKGF